MSDEVKASVAGRQVGPDVPSGRWAVVRGEGGCSNPADPGGEHPARPTTPAGPAVCPFCRSAGDYGSNGPKQTTLFDLLSRHASFRDGVGPCMVIDMQTVADFYRHGKLKWRSVQKDDLCMIPDALQTFTEYAYTEVADGLTRHWWVGNLIRVEPKELVVPDLQQAVGERVRADLDCWVQVDTFYMARETQWTGGPPTIPSGRPLHSVNVYVIGLPEGGRRVQSFTITPIQNERGEIESPFGFDRIRVRHHRHHPVAYPCVPFTGFALLSGGACRLHEYPGGHGYKAVLCAPPSFRT